MSSFSVLKYNQEKLNNHINNVNWHIERRISLKGINSTISSYYPLKSIRYFINRYELHPIYKYNFWCIYEKDSLKSIWAVRRLIINGASIFRVVDVLGRLDDIPDLYNEIQTILHSENAEYVDIMNYGITNDVFERMGFKEVDFLSNEIICPNYFEPFEQKNIVIEVAYKSKEEYVAFKGDSDQDRPSIL